MWYDVIRKGENDMTMGDRIKRLRQERGWSQKDLADKLGYQDRSIISLVEQGKRGIDIDTVVRYADLFGVEPTFLLGWETVIDDDEQQLIDRVCQDEGMKKRLLAYATKLKEILDEENAPTS